MRTRLVTLLMLLVSAAAFAADDRHFEQKVAADPHGAVDISNVAGSVTVTAWDQPSVEVKAVLDNDQMQVRVASEQGRTLVSVGHKGVSFSGGEARLEVRIPQNSELEVTAVSAKVSSTGVLGTQRLKTVSGKLTADVGPGDTEVKTVSGDIRMRGTGRPGTLRVDSVSGDVSLEHGAGDLDATTISGDLHAEVSPGHTVRLHTTSGAIAFEGTLQRDATLDAESINGDVKIKVPSDGGFEYEVSTFSGDIKSCFGQVAEHASAYGPGRRLSGTRGAGGARVRVKSLSGSVTLCDQK